MFACVNKNRFSAALERLSERGRSGLAVLSCSAERWFFHLGVIEYDLIAQPASPSPWAGGTKSARGQCAQTNVADARIPSKGS